MHTIRSITLLGLATLLFFGFAYPLVMVGVGKLFQGGGNGFPLYRGDTLIGYENIGQPFHSPGYFHGRPSAVDYNGAATGGSNKGPTNREFLEVVRSRIDTLLSHNPGLAKREIPIELVTTSGSGLDPHITKEGAILQVRRIALARRLPEGALTSLIESHSEGPFLGLFGPADRINVLKLNLALDSLAGA